MLRALMELSRRFLKQPACITGDSGVQCSIIFKAHDVGVVEARSGIALPLISMRRSGIDSTKVPISHSSIFRASVWARRSSFSLSVGSRANRKGVWIALARRTPMGLAVGDRLISVWRHSNICAMARGPARLKASSRS
ncbi:hypothetical protein PG993_014648 [Apiospora rasikravindrae]|uniref:Uncharacterized protein n=1 Tax=Apiospora rasikravindrae TaxID=990691 RepID=A0ABR1RPI2_9PEZI